MSTLFWVELVCACCNSTTSGAWTDGRVRVREMKSDARKVGWSFYKKDAFCSQRCSDQYLREKAERETEIRKISEKGS